MLSTATLLVVHKYSSTTTVKATVPTPTTVNGVNYIALAQAQVGIQQRMPWAIGVVIAIVLALKTISVLWPC
jgi:hypothetical protein